ncbi:uncharacterized protein LOC105389906 isoform X5 [Plutella xylostella]|uniref:uncharacterized protein LOC105389906 isoform X5 n=1 Tax=Plutella xylostella TaxID=51655 RepID=UPI002032E1A1|nr:uncharacterized protein LOC105389906 isoform X5 [Plutella xylostella]
MAPGKFGLFKTRSRDQPEQPSTENLLQHSSSGDTLATPGSPIPSTSRTTPEELAEMEMAAFRGLQGDDQDCNQNALALRRASGDSIGETQINYQELQNDSATDATSTSTFAEDFLDETLQLEDDIHPAMLNLDLDDGASTSADANSLQFDELSMAPSEDLSIHCSALKRPKKSRSKEEQQMRDFDMWQASNVEVMENLLSRRCPLDEQIKWEAIATSRGLCTLTDICTCNDCRRAKYLAEVTDGDGGMGAAPLFNAITVGCCVQ